MAIVRAVMWERGGAWFGRFVPPEARDVTAASRDACVELLAGRVPKGSTLVVEVGPELVGVSEAASILGWDRRRVVTYIDRGSFPHPIATLASGRVWRRSDVVDFARAWHGGHPVRAVPPGAA